MDSSLEIESDSNVPLQFGAFSNLKCINSFNSDYNEMQNPTIEQPEETSTSPLDMKTYARLEHYTPADPKRSLKPNA